MVLIKTKDGLVLLIDKFTDNENAVAYFLTHLHSDHTIGLAPWMKRNIKAMLSNTKPQKMYCHRITKNILLNDIYQELGLDEKFVQLYGEERVLEYLKTLIIGVEYNSTLVFRNEHIDNNDDDHATRITFFDANHCPGSIMMKIFTPAALAKQVAWTILYTSDFRYHPVLHQFAITNVDELYMDSSFLLPLYKSFPNKETVWYNLLKQIETKYKTNNNLSQKNPVIVQVDVEVLGREWVLPRLADFFQVPISTNLSIYKHHNRLLMMPEIQPYIVEENLSTSNKPYILRPGPVNTTKESPADINITLSTLSFFQPESSSQSKHLPTEKNQDKQKQQNVISLLYGMHSSFEELLMFLSSFNPKPKKIILLSEPIVSSLDEKNKKFVQNTWSSSKMITRWCKQIMNWDKNYDGVEIASVSS